MATVRTFTHRELDRVSTHGEVEATISLVDIGGEKFLQIDTYGSVDRQMPGKVSQSLHLSKEALDELVKAATRHF